MHDLGCVMGGVDHCRSHCRLTKFRGLMYGGKYSAVIGRKCVFLHGTIMNFQAMGSFKPITASAALPPHISNHGISPNDSVSNSG